MKSFVITLSLMFALASARSIYMEGLHYARIYPRQTTDNLQTFTGNLGAAADVITFSGDDTRPFEVNGDTFVNFAAAAQRTCDIQFNACANAANSGAAFSVSTCSSQESEWWPTSWSQYSNALTESISSVQRSPDLCDSEELLACRCYRRGSCGCVDRHRWSSQSDQLCITRARKGTGRRAVQGPRVFLLWWRLRS